MRLKLQVAYKLLVESAANGSQLRLSELSNLVKVEPDLLAEILGRSKAISIVGDEIRVTDVPRLILEAWRDGFSLVEVALSAGWRDVEDLCELMLSERGYRTFKHLRIRHSGLTRELDVVAFSEPYVLAFECKRWRRASPSMLKAAAESQAVRCELLARALSRSHTLRGLVEGWREARVYPLVLTVIKGNISVVEGVPVVSFYQLHSFLDSLPCIRDELRYFRVV